MNIFKLFSTALLVLFVNTGFSQVSNQHYNLVVEVPSFSEGKTIQVWKDALVSIDGVVIQEYCADQGWLVLSVDDAIIPSGSDPEIILRNAGLQGIIKYSATAAQVEANCNGKMKYFNKRTHQ